MEGREGLERTRWLREEKGRKRGEIVEAVYMLLCSPAGAPSRRGDKCRRGKEHRADNHLGEGTTIDVKNATKERSALLYSSYIRVLGLYCDHAILPNSHLEDVF